VGVINWYFHWKRGRQSGFSPIRYPRARSRFPLLRTLLRMWTNSVWKHPCDRHVGVPSWGQQVATTSNISYILIKYLIALASFQALDIVSTSSRAPKFLFPPTRSFFPLLRSMAHYLRTQHTHGLFGRGGSMKGVHPPPPSSFALWRSRPTIDFFGAPRRLPTRTKFTSTGELRQHPQEVLTLSHSTKLVMW